VSTAPATTVEVRCATCLYRARMSADGAVVQELQEGGVRAPDPHPTLVAWRTWARSRAGELGPVVGRCPRCDMPLIAESAGLAPSEPWTLDSPRGPVRVGADELVGPTGPLTDAQAEASLASQLEPRAVDQLLDPRLIFVGVVLIILALIALVWLGAALYVANFLLAMGTQGNFSAPAVP